MSIPDLQPSPWGAPVTAPIQDLFNRIAPVYDACNDWLSFGLHRVWKQMAVQWSRAKPGDRGLDVCCGSGDLALRLARQVGPSGRVYGVDFAAAQLTIARQRSLTSPFPLDWVEANALDLPFEDNFFDAATMGYGLRNVPDLPRCLGELHRVLKPGATIAILDFNHPSNETMQHFQQWYLTQLVVPVAQKLGLTEEYAYLVPSLERFPRGPQQVQLARDAGFTTVVHYPIASGLMGVLVATK